MILTHRKAAAARALLLDLVVERDHGAGRIGAKPDAVTAMWPEGRKMEYPAARRDELDRPAINIAARATKAVCRWTHPFFPKTPPTVGLLTSTTAGSIPSVRATATLIAPAF
jgi:hypothetical protein